MKKLLTGRAAFVLDLSPSGLLHLGLVVSPHEHARVTGVDSALARSIPGVVEVITPEDEARPAPGQERARSRGVLSAVAPFLGAPVAIVVAEDPEIAGRGAEAVRVSYEPRPAVRFTPDETPEGAPAAQVRVEAGDVDAVFAEADQVLEVTHRFTRTRPRPLEPPVALAWLDEDGRLVVRTATASPLRLRRLLADALGVAGGRIRIERPEVGGDFGARGGAFLEEACALVALRTGRPARIALRPDHPAGGFEGSACQVSARAAVRGGRVAGVDVRLRADIGAAPAEGEVEAEFRRAAALLETYAFAAARFEASACSTHAPPAGGSAALATSVALEGLLDEVAEALGDDRLAFRKRHLAAAHEAGLSAMLDRCARGGGLSRGLKAAAEKAVRRGVGLALVRSTLAGADAHATVSRNEDGSFTVAWGPCEASTSAGGLLEALAARALGAPPESVAANLSAPAEPPAPGVADLWLTAQAVEAAAAEMAGKAARTTGANPSASASRRADHAPAPAGAFLAEVELDPETGMVTLLRLVLALGGGSAEPLVLAKAEGDAWRGAGLVLFGSASGSRTPRAVDLPRILTLPGSDEEARPLGAAPIGDVAFLGGAAAVANAVAQAVGTRIPDLPLHPERVRAVLEEGGS